MRLLYLHTYFSCPLLIKINQFILMFIILPTHNNLRLHLQQTSQGGLGFFATMYQIIKTTDPGSKNPAVNREMNNVGGNPVEVGGYKKLME